MTKPTILIVDDSDAEVVLSKIVLKQFRPDLELIHLHDGVELLDFLCCQKSYSHRDIRENDNIKLVLLDINMPRMSGTAALKFIKSDSTFSELPIVMFSSSSSASDIKECYERGANSYLVKPMNFELFQSSMTRIADYWLSLNHTACAI